MKKMLAAVTLFICLNQSFSALAKSSDDSSSGNGVSLGFTHLLPSTYVPKSGSLIVGTSLGYGILGIGELSTNLFYDFDNVYNVFGKVSFWQGEDFGFAIHATYTSQNVDKIDSLGAVTKIMTTSIAPGFTLSYRLFQELTGHAGAIFVNRDPNITKNDIASKSGFLQGTTIFKEFTLGFGRNVAISLGGTYDTTFDYWGAGMSVHFEGFQLGGHYYFGVTDGQFLPIVGIGYTAGF
jgi:hypothetical protein